MLAVFCWETATQKQDQAHCPGTPGTLGAKQQFQEIICFEREVAVKLTL